MKLGSAVYRFLVQDYQNIWMVSIMGTAISANILYSFPYSAQWLRICSYIMFGCALICFFLNTIIFFLKYVVYRSYLPDGKTFYNVADTLCLGCYGMGLSSIINMLCYLTNPSSTPQNWVNFIYIIWIFNTVMSFYTSWVIFSFVFTKRVTFQFSTLLGNIVLPFVPLTVASATGTVVAQTFWSRLSRTIFLNTIITCYICWANAVSVGFCVIGIIIWRLIFYKYPDSPVAFTQFVPIGVLGQGAFGIIMQALNIKTYAHNYLQNISSVNIYTNVLLIISGFLSLFLISLAYFLTFVAFFGVFTHGVRHDFTVLWWAITFPLGTMSISNSKLGEVAQLTFFRVLGAIYGVACIFITIVCILGSLYLGVLKFRKEFFQQNLDNSLPISVTDETKRASSGRSS
ncbi:sulfite sensitivity protein SSU1 [Schizosaccharomyces octosporus yFS286]|uniref:Sulfite sensitivity protein SSU1 n=1 Tax=Schizosaccharomyces octosporus (strain yFS286) TaxID=483514 RepID=S9Q1G8_SCHOY|nr:sulfite sensitivity protein SSU1 [Schizosaccharomyces octosporus yFS286]EPX75106.1 sulfite sensitivity protein SSU1 [Schizosaccharomyces octosporus yFS286]